MRNSKRLLVGLAVLSLTTAGSMGSATARNFDGCTAATVGTEPCFANNSNHYFSYLLDAEMRTAQEATRTGSYETTDLSTFLSAHADSNGYAISDVHAASGENANNPVGLYTCLEYDASNSGRCYHAHIGYDRSQLTPHYGNPETLRYVACHETGHSVGLRHEDNVDGVAGRRDPAVTDDLGTYQCMNGAGVTRIFLGGHNVDHIQGKY